MLTTERLVIGLLNRARQKCVGKSIWEDASPYIKITFQGTHTSQGRLAHAMALENIRCPSTHKSFSQWRSFAIGTHTLSVDPRKSGAIHTLLSLKSNDHGRTQDYFQGGLDSTPLQPPFPSLWWMEGVFIPSHERHQHTRDGSSGSAPNSRTGGGKT